MRGFRQWRWHLDEVYVKINGEMHYLWRAVDREGDILESYVTKDRDKAAALKTEAQAYTAPEALRLGLVDAIGDPHRAFKAFVQEVNRKGKS